MGAAVPTTDPRIQRARPPGDERAAMAAEVRASLTAPVPWLPSKYFYDEHGSRLFEEITRLPEYYLTRTEVGILEDRADAIVAGVEADELVELGAGAGRKIRLVLDAMARRGTLRRLTLLDVHEQGLRLALDALERDYPGLHGRAVVGDFTEDLDSLGPGGGRLLAFLGSTIGNLEPAEVPRFLRAARGGLDEGDALLLGVDLVKDRRRLEAAYNDSAGVTEAFNLNLLCVLNRVLGADFERGGWQHVAFYDDERGWIEMRLRCRRAAEVHIPAADLELRFARGDEIRTEISCKFTRASLEGSARGTGLGVTEWHADREELFALAVLRPSRS
jgi:L-histidine N-alpha-methyltransferase